MKRLNILTIAGSDVSGGAGLQGDLKTIAAHSMHGISAITAITAQNSKRIVSIEECTTLEQQLEAIFEDISLSGIKIGMVYSKKNIEAIHHFILKNNTRSPILLDPLMFSSTGYRLCQEEAITALQHLLFPLATLVTPNRYEAEYIVGRSITSVEAMEKAAEEMANRFQTSILLKGGHIEGAKSIDVLWEKDASKSLLFEAPKKVFSHSHGTGCALSTAIVCRLAQGKSLVESIHLSKQLIIKALEEGFPVGKGEGNIDTLLYRL